MIIFLFGADEYRRLEKKRDIAAQFKKKHPEGLEARFEAGKEGEMDRLREFARGTSLFIPEKLAVLEGELHEFDAKSAKGFKEYVHLPRTTVLISQARVPGREFAFLCRPPVLWQEFSSMTGAAWRAWVGEKSKALGMAIADEALAFLSRVFEGNTWGLVTELEKVGSVGRRVELSDLRELHAEASPDFWSLVTGLGGAALSGRLAALETLLSHREPAAKIFHMTSSLPRENPAVWAAYDVAIKSGKLDYEEALVDAAIR